MGNSVAENILGIVIFGGLSFMILMGLFSLTDAGQTMAYVADTGDFAGYLHHGVDEDHWSVALGMELHNLANR